MEHQDNPIDLEEGVDMKPEEPTAGDGNPKRKKKNSDVWQHFIIPDPVPIDNPRTLCKYCGEDYAYRPSKIGTSSLWGHLRNRCKKYPYREQDKKQKTLVFQKTTDGGEGVNLTAIAFSKDFCRKALAKMVIVDELPFRFVEKEGFRHFCSSMQPKFALPCRMTVAKDVISLYVEEKEKLKTMFANSSQQVCLTTDTWTSLQNINYMVLTAHYIDENWKLQKRILNFESISNHKGETIGKMIEACLISWGLERVFTITVDNVSSNDVVISFVKKKIRNWGKSILNCDHLHMRCCAHILNLVVTQGLKDYDTSIQVIRNAVRYVRSSPSRLHKFKECVEKEKLDISGNVCLDVPTRWNSTFLMLHSALKFRRAFERMEEDGNYSRYFHERSSSIENNSPDKIDITRTGPPTDLDWEDAKNFMQFLELFYEVTKRFSGSLYVTSNNYFHDLCLVQAHIADCLKADNSKLKIMASEMKGKFDKYWGDLEKVNPLLFVSVVLDPRYKLSYINWSFNEMHEDANISSKMSAKVEETLKKLYAHYCKLDLQNTKEESSSQQNVNFGGNVELEGQDILKKRLLKYKSFLKSGEVVENTELDKYLKDARESIDGPFDLLGWWKMNSTKYKVLSCIAKDVLAVPVSTVSSESAFSTGGRVLDSYRSNLTPKTVQALICAQNWLRTDMSQGKIDITSALEEIEDIEKVEKDFTLLNICTDHIELYEWKH